MIKKVTNEKHVDPNKIKIDKKSYKNILIYSIGNVMIEDVSCVKINNVNPLWVFINKINKYIEESNKNIYLMLVSTDESKEMLKQYEEVWDKIRNIIKSITNNSDKYDENI